MKEISAEKCDPEFGNVSNWNALHLKEHFDDGNDNPVVGAEDEADIKTSMVNYTSY